MRLALVILLLATTTASANPEEPKSQDAALALSLGITTLSWGVIAYDTRSPEIIGAAFVGTLVGPTTGHWYSGRIVTWGLGLRVLGTVAATAGLFEALAHDDCHDACGGTPDGVILLPIGLLAYGIGTISDIVTARAAARDYNERHRNMSIVPLVQPGSAGVGVGGRF
jgi:hypothetical protein